MSFRIKLARRSFLQGFAGAVVSLGDSQAGRALTFSAKPLRIVVGFAPGGASDIFARLIGQWLSQRLGQVCIVENRPGAAGNLATEAVAKSPSDGTTLLLVGTTAAINVALYVHLNFNFWQDIVPVAGLVRFPQIVVVNTALPVKSVLELIAYAKVRPGEIAFSSGGIGGLPHLAGEMFKMMAGVDLLHVPYRGGEGALTSLLSGTAQLYFAAPAECIQLIKAGAVRAIAVTAAAPSSFFPDLPTVAEFVPGYVATSFFGLGAPAGTPMEIVTTINREVNSALSDDGFRARLVEWAATSLAGAPEDFGRFIGSEAETWTRVIKRAGITLQ